ncbi:MAG: AAA family ATPase [Blastochloris sp.]|nr:AAA family ATPase [Blastochloris sp.]
MERFCTRETGISIFEGPPGTGKTTYIRELMRLLKDSHRFYFLPSSNLDALKNPELIDFWSGERRRALSKNLVVILEDAESALVPRHEDNRKQVSVLLNITDGILGEFLKLQIIATVNCGIHEIDQALLRPGRLVARRHFGHLSPEQAGKLAESQGKCLKEGQHLSLADILAENDELDEDNIQPRRMVLK